MIFETNATRAIELCKKNNDIDILKECLTNYQQYVYQDNKAGMVAIGVIIIITILSLIWIWSKFNK